MIFKYKMRSMNHIMHVIVIYLTSCDFLPYNLSHYETPTVFYYFAQDRATSKDRFLY